MAEPDSPPVDVEARKLEEVRWLSCNLWGSHLLVSVLYLVSFREALSLKHAQWRLLVLAFCSCLFPDVPLCLSLIALHTGFYSRVTLQALFLPSHHLVSACLTPRYDVSDSVRARGLTSRTFLPMISLERLPTPTLLTAFTPLSWLLDHFKALRILSSFSNAFSHQQHLTNLPSSSPLAPQVGPLVQHRQDCRLRNHQPRRQRHTAIYW